MVSIGHGISDAVRNHIPHWIDDPTVDALYVEYKESGGVLSKGSFANRVRSSSQWIRKSRKTTDTGFSRLYECKTVKKATLIVSSPESDDRANEYLFNIEGKSIAGGRTKLKSTHVSSTISKSDKTSTKAMEVQFIRYSPEELASIMARMEFETNYDLIREE